MKEKQKVVFSWSGGKDSAMALYELRKDTRYQVVALLASVAQQYRRISHHGVREELLERQAAAIGLPLDRVYLPTSSSHPCTNEVYERIMEQAMLKHKAAGIQCVAFGDIFLRDLRQYRENNLGRFGMQGVFPLWQRNTTDLVRIFVALGFRAYICCVEGKLGRRFAGRAIDAALIRDLPPGVDPCGEYGEYHTFVYDGPIFKKPVRVKVGPIVMRDGRYYADLLPVEIPLRTALKGQSIPPVC